MRKLGPISFASDWENYVKEQLRIGYFLRIWLLALPVTGSSVVHLHCVRISLLCSGNLPLELFIIEVAKIIHSPTN